MTGPAPLPDLPQRLLSALLTDDPYPEWPKDAELEITFRERLESVIEEHAEEEGASGVAEAIMDELGITGDGWVTVRTPRHPRFLDPIPEPGVVDGTPWTCPACAASMPFTFDEQVPPHDGEHGRCRNSGRYRCPTCRAIPRPWEHPCPTCRHESVVTVSTA